MLIDPEKGELIYPCQWSYRVIGRDREGVRQAVESVLGEREFLLYYAKSSSGGKYCSWQVDLVVCNAEERNSIFAQLKSHLAITVVI